MEAGFLTSPFLTSLVFLTSPVCLLKAVEPVGNEDELEEAGWVFEGSSLCSGSVFPPFPVTA